ncbi:MAG: hypothetical protein IKJ14_01165 [Clostridia bacterium]|nr:hypothetical protein [Clostridia bacterium]
MGNFMRRTLAFFLGMIVAFALVVGALVGGGYWAFKNLTPKDVGVKEETLGGLSSMTFEEWTAFIVDIKKDPQAFTVKELEKKGFNVNSFLTTMGVDVENANPKDIESFKELAIGSMFGGGALQEVGMGVVFLFIPKNSETGKYPIFSEGARNRLRQFTLADFFGGETDNSGYSSVLRSMKLGSVLSSSYEEVLLPDGTFEYVSEDRGLNLLANVELGVLTDKRESGFDIGHEVQDGYLSSLKDKELIEIIASFGSKDEETFNAKYEGLAILSGVTLGETFVWSDEQNKYAFSPEPILNCLNIGKFMGVELCTKNESCPVHENVLDCDGELYEGGVISTKPDLEKGLLKNLAGISVVDLMSGGLDINAMLDGLYLGSAFGYKKCTGDSSCPVHGAVDPYVNCEDSIGKWFDDTGAYVGKMFDKLSANSFVDALNGNLDIEGIINETKVGEIFGYVECSGDAYCEVHDLFDCSSTLGNWYDSDGNPIERNDVTSKVMYQLYGKTLNDFDTLQIDELMGGIKLGEFMGYVYNEDENRWEDEGGVPADALYESIADIYITELMNNPKALTDEIGELYFGEFMKYEKSGDEWLDGGKVVTGVNKTLADIKLSEVLDGTLDIQTELNGIKIGEILGYTYNGSIWVDENEIPAPKTETVDKIFYEMYGKTLNDLSGGGISMEELLVNVTLGEFLGLTYDDTDNRWEQSDGTKASILYSTIADVNVSALIANPNLLNDRIGTLYVGDFMGYVKSGSDWLNGSVSITGVDKIIADISLSAVLNGTLNIKDELKYVSVGDVMGLTYDGTTWYDNGVAIDNTDITGKVFYGIYGRSVSEFGSLEIGDLLQGIKLGEFLGLKYESGGWKDANGDDASVLYATIADIDVPALLQDGTLITKKLETLYVGDFMGYEFNGTAWTDGGVALTGVDKLLAEISLGDVLNGTVSLDVNSLKLEDLIETNGNKVLEYLCSGGTTINGINAKVNNMTLGDVIDTNGNTMLTLLKDTSLDDLATKIDSLYIGEVMGFTRCTGDSSCPVHGAVDCLATKDLWYERIGENWVLEVGVEARVADLQIADMDEHGIKSLEFVMGDVLTHDELDHGLFALAHLGVIKDEYGVVTNPNEYEDVAHIPMSEFAERVSIGAEEASYAELDHAGVMHLSDETTAKLDFVFDSVHGVGVWETWTIDRIFSEIVALIPSGA